MGLANLDVSKIISTSKETNIKSISNDNTNNSPIPKSDLSNPPGPNSNIQNNNTDSDSVVSDSENEAEPQEYRHIVKRRRIIASVPSQSNSLVDNTNLNNSIAVIQKTTSLPIQMEKQETKSMPNSSAKPINKADEESSQDFSADEDKDADFVPEETKSKRKKAVAKRRQAAVKKEKPEKTEKPTKKLKSEKSVTKRPKLSRTSSKASKEAEPTENQSEEKPLDPEDLKYALALERASISSVPRVKLAELEQADNLAKEYINSMNASKPLVNKQLPQAVINEKRQAARKKFEEKIASGKLNENFVTINIQKKTFVRGKKSINYSKYKKQQWKHKKKIAALSGPNMDMGGCDGGVLTCFTCGQPGHFAQQCKLKGDSLLPLTAQLEEDPSPFPTLEEAASMASQSAVAVHSRNISKLPQATNAFIYNKENEQEQAQEIQSDDDNSHQLADSDSDSADSEAEEEICMETDDEFEGMDIEMAINEQQQQHTQQQTSPIKQYAGHCIPEEFLQKAGMSKEDLNEPSAAKKHGGINGLYDLNADGSVKDVTPEVMEALHLFGHSSFRKGMYKL